MGIRTLAVSCTFACLLAAPARSQDKPQPPTEELEVTMRIIVDPDAKVPESVVRRIKLPTVARPAEAGRPQAKPSPGDRPAQSGEEFGKEISERAREMAQQAAENREGLGRSIAEEARRKAPTPDERPGPPIPPPGRP